MKGKLLTVVVMLIIGIGGAFYLNWYLGLPVLKKTPDGKEVAFEIKGSNYDPEIKENYDTYHTRTVSPEWKPED